MIFALIGPEPAAGSVDPEEPTDPGAGWWPLARLALARGLVGGGFCAGLGLLAALIEAGGLPSARALAYAVHVGFPLGLVTFAPSALVERFVGEQAAAWRVGLVTFAVVTLAWSAGLLQALYAASLWTEEVNSALSAPLRGLTLIRRQPLAWAVVLGIPVSISLGAVVFHNERHFGGAVFGCALTGLGALLLTLYFVLPQAAWIVVLTIGFFLVVAVPGGATLYRVSDMLERRWRDDPGDRLVRPPLLDRLILGGRSFLPATAAWGFAGLVLWLATRSPALSVGLPLGSWLAHLALALGWPRALLRWRQHQRALVVARYGHTLSVRSAWRESLRQIQVAALTALDQPSAARIVAGTGHAQASGSRDGA